MITKKNISQILLTTFLSAMVLHPLFSQESKFSDLENIQDEIENLYVKTYTIFEEHPNLTYEYVYEGDDLIGIEIYGVDDLRDKKRLEVYMMDIEELENKILNVTTRTGVYYVTETEPKPADGYEEFYEDLRTYIDYPDLTTFRNMEGTLYAKFVVNDHGEINNVIFTSNFDDKDNIQVQKMKEEAKEAILATSGDWTPAKVENVPVSQWVVLPVQFEVKERNYPFPAL